MARRKVLVCGVTGFIGRNVALRLAERDDLDVYGVHWTRDAFAHPRITMIRADLTDAAQVDKVVAGMDIVIQAAATTSGAADIVQRPYIHTTDNAVMNSLLLRAAYDHAVKHFVFFSCTVMYQSSDQPLAETDFDANAEVYPNYFGSAWTKLYIEKMCEFYARLGRTRHTVIRHSNIYGPYDKFDLARSHVFGATITKVLSNSDGVIRVWGTGEEERDLLYVDDLVDFVEAAMEHQGQDFALYNAGRGKAIAIRDLVALIIARSGRDLRIEYDTTRPTIKTTLCLDCAKAERELGWTPRVALEDGIDRTIAWWRANVPMNNDSKG